jgi:hypothetical protein
MSLSRWQRSSYVKPVGALAKSCVVLLDKVPADLILGDLVGRRLLRRLAGGRLLGWCEVGGAGSIAVLVGLRPVVAVDRARGLGCRHIDVGWRQCRLGSWRGKSGIAVARYNEFEGTAQGLATVRFYLGTQF